MDTSIQYPLITEMSNNHSKVCKRRNSKNGLDNGNSRVRSRSPRSAIEKSHLMVNNPISDDDNNNSNDNDSNDKDDDRVEKDNAMIIRLIKKEKKCSVVSDKEKGNNEKDVERCSENSWEKGRGRGREKEERREQQYGTKNENSIKDFNRENVLNKNKIKDNEKGKNKNENNGREKVREHSLEKTKIKNKELMRVDTSIFNKIKDDKNSENGDELAALYDREKDRNNEYEQELQHENENENENESDSDDEDDGHYYKIDHQENKEKEKDEAEENDSNEEARRGRERGRRKDTNKNINVHEDVNENEDKDKDDNKYLKGRHKVVALDMARMRNRTNISNDHNTSLYEMRTVKSKEKNKERVIDQDKNGGELREIRDNSRSPRLNDNRSRPHLIGVRR